ncbi:hypothetical protein OG887_43275 (plasmid) [Streptomyces sp. NBC_00053]|uniref:hypothetical protein n=1 Tax=unclassified Streptomyces TaxID=2593676 RepID=UPI002259B9A6|nr:MULTISPECIES: hypothetical protein [unclassified Streptomyces]MCX4399521.1 hypothetical protein [Streptomyces sp. NBC_01767]MCX4400070.1 hypothetical protein [Streptomyces sp. NBC_01767]MCX5106777.1 hypothetical protein [Streptomyces sp. NBC_00439]MCX5506135.1 hypothetical protein [Streptomyces sp. NBC_00052]MCX5554162.1 hypothetical protein [Streptomyces sp. NBC_00051]
MDRYRLTLAIGARTIMRGWWPDLPTAERKYLRWIGERSCVNGTRVTLVDEAADGRALESWPPD